MIVVVVRGGTSNDVSVWWCGHGKEVGCVEVGGEIERCLEQWWLWWRRDTAPPVEKLNSTQVMVVVVVVKEW